MKKKVISILLCAALCFSFAAGCGAEEETDSNSETQSEETAADGDEEESQEVNGYGMTDAQLEALLESVKDSVTTEYLDKFNISPADFQVLPYDANDFNNYDSVSGAYTGSDPYEWANVWWTVDNAIASTSDFNMHMSAYLAGGFSAEEIAEILVEEGVTFSDSLDPERYLLDPASERYALRNSVYQGIVNFLNSLDEMERNLLLVNRYQAETESERVRVGTETMGREYYSETMFDRAVSENIQFS